MSIQLLEDRITQKLNEINAKIAVRDMLQKQHDALVIKQHLLTAKLNDNEEASIVIGAVEKNQQEQLKMKLERLVSYALSVIFEKQYKFVVEFDQRGNQSDATFLVVDDLGNAQNVKEAHGGGILVVVAYILRAIVMMSAQPKLLPIMIDDEPFAQVSADYRDRLVEFLQRFAESSGVQLVMVTHNQDLAEIGDKRYRFKLVNGRTVVEEI